MAHDTHTPTTAGARPERGPRTPAAAFACPKCQGVMREYDRGGLILELCEDCRGIFLDKGELERLIEVEGGGWSGIVTAAVDPRS